jgi:hypothetical protein
MTNHWNNLQAHKAFISLGCTWPNTWFMGHQPISKKLLYCLIRSRYDSTLLSLMYRSRQLFLYLFTSLAIEVLALTPLCGIYSNASSPQTFSLPVDRTLTIAALTHISPHFSEKEKPPQMRRLLFDNQTIRHFFPDSPTNA